MKKLVTFAFAIAVLGVPATTRADDTDQVAKQSFERGRQLAGEAKWTQAFDAFSAGYDASHRSVFLFNMAECARALDDAPRARGLYQQYLAASPSGDLADTARARIAAMPAPPATTPTPAPATAAHPTISTTPTPAPLPTPTPTTGSTTRPTTTTPPAPTTVATRPVVIPPPLTLPHATTLSTTPLTTPAPAPATTAIRATTPPRPTTATAAPTLTVAQLPPTSPAERPISTTMLVDAHPSEPIWRRTSFWVGVGVAVAAGTVAIIAASSHDNSCSSPGCIDLRR